MTFTLLVLVLINIYNLYQTIKVNKLSEKEIELYKKIIENYKRQIEIKDDIILNHQQTIKLLKEWTLVK